MSQPPEPWVAPEPASPGTPPGRASGLPPAGPPAAGAMNFSAGAPLGGVAPSSVPDAPTTDRRELALTGVLLVIAVLAGATSLMPWRDYGRRFGAAATETGWVRTDGSMGRGWLFVALAVSLAVAGVLIAGGRARAGRILASLTGSAMVVAAILEWGIGDGAVRSGPGTGLWVELVLGVATVIAVGVLGPKDTTTT